MNINYKKVLALSLVSLLSVSSAVQAAVLPSFWQFGKNDATQVVAPVEQKTDKKSDSTDVLPSLGTKATDLYKAVIGSAMAISAYDTISQKIPSKQACLQFINNMPAHAKSAAAGLVAGAKFAYHNPLLVAQTHPYAVGLAATAVGSYGAYKGYQWYTRTPEKLLNEAAALLPSEQDLKENAEEESHQQVKQAIDKINQAFKLASNQLRNKQIGKDSEELRRFNQAYILYQSVLSNDLQLRELNSTINALSISIESAKVAFKNINDIPTESSLTKAKDAVWNHKWKTLGTLSALGLAATVAKNPELITMASAMATTAYNAARNYDYRALYNNYCNRQALAKGVSTVGTALSTGYACTRDAVANGWSQAFGWAKSNPRAAAVAAISVPVVTSTAGTGVVMKSRNTEHSKKAVVVQVAAELNEAFGKMFASEDIKVAQKEIEAKIDAISKIVTGCNYPWATQIKELISNVPANFNDNKKHDLEGLINFLVVGIRYNRQHYWVWHFNQVSKCIQNIQAAVSPDAA